MSAVTIFGTGKMGSAIAEAFARTDVMVQVIKRSSKVAATVERAGATYSVVGDDLLGDVIILAVPYESIFDVIARYRDQLAGKVIVDISNPIDFTTFDELVVPSDSSAAAQIAKEVPDAAVVKAFNINFAETLASGTNGGFPTTVVMAGDDADAKRLVVELVELTGLRAVDCGLLSRARDLEALGFLQITLAALAKTKWESGFVLVP